MTSSRHQTITDEPYSEILAAIDNIGKIVCQNYVILIVVYNGIPVGLVSATFDDNLQMTTTDVMATEDLNDPRDFFSIHSKVKSSMT